MEGGARALNPAGDTSVYHSRERSQEESNLGACHHYFIGEWKPRGGQAQEGGCRPSGC